MLKFAVIFLIAALIAAGLAHCNLVQATAQYICKIVCLVLTMASLTCLFFAGQNAKK